MSIHVAVEHRTAYGYDRAVTLSPHVVRLRPAPHCRQPILAYSMRVTPTDHFVNWHQDPFGNHLARLVFPEPARELTVTVDLVADLTVINPFDFFIDEDAQTYPFHYEPYLATDLSPYLSPAGVGAPVTDWIRAFRDVETPTIDFLVLLNQQVAKDIAYTVRMDPGVQGPDETLQLGVGSCRDTAWLLVNVLRRLGIAARFASGYLVQLAADEPPVSGPAGPSEDFTDLHAWAEAYVPGAGWVGLDPTSGLLAGEGHIPLACTPHPASAAPITGAASSEAISFSFYNHVQRVREDRRVTKPYREDEWARIDALGRAVDASLLAGDVRLTLGGEPTFVSVADMEAPEWNVAADGGDKRAMAARLAGRLAGRFAPGGLVQHGQGKWYPGEPLPRWQITVSWRVDGVPLWLDRALLAEPGPESGPGDGLAPSATPAGDDPATAFAAALGDALGLPGKCCLPAFEDPLHRLWTEARLPAGAPPAVDVAPDARAAASRAGLIAALDAERGAPAGYVIPLHRGPGDDEWHTARWRLRRGHLFLVPGDSPIGLRLPLDSIAWSPQPVEPDPSPFRPVLPLPSRDNPPAPVRLTGPEEPVRTTALCVESRAGAVQVFLPPLAELAHAVELVRLIEAVAARLGQPVVVGGYPLAADSRIQTLSVGPDPGVIEVNMQPVTSWPELVDVTTTLFAEARQAGLGTEKFGLDGTHAGTGGGAHITLGGSTPADSPVLRRPDLLRSLITYWQHHPGLSYLFAGRFVGPTSQAPRVDEGRHESLYELEIAFAELERLGRRAAPWHADRLLRDLLVDVTGNTHRAELCIDKLFSPDSERGRLGLVELRSFEMPPHPRMALVQALLVRTIVARMWAHPYKGALVRWGTDLHDRFLLPWWVAHDVAEVVDDLAAHGLAFERDWLEPFVEFRFPRLGEVSVAGLHVELRAAIEPWNVLGEQVAQASTARFVDSSVERLQVRVDGLTGSRYALACNGVEVPLQPTGTPGTLIAGIRYRAWSPPSALHPTIGVHAPLVFDVIDRWSDRSVGGCTYHVVHPGGLAYERFPVNANEAEARRRTRFSASGHTPGAPVAIAAHPGGDEYPRTLDLRRTAPSPHPGPTGT